MRNFSVNSILWSIVISNILSEILFKTSKKPRTIEMILKRDHIRILPRSVNIYKIKSSCLKILEIIYKVNIKTTPGSVSNFGIITSFQKHNFQD